MFWVVGFTFFFFFNKKFFSAKLVQYLTHTLLSFEENLDFISCLPLTLMQAFPFRLVALSGYLTFP